MWNVERLRKPLIRKLIRYWKYKFQWISKIISSLYSLKWPLLVENVLLFIAETLIKFQKILYGDKKKSKNVRTKNLVILSETCVNERARVNVIHIYIYSHTHTHRHIYIYMYIYLCAWIVRKTSKLHPEKGSSQAYFVASVHYHFL